MTRRGGRSRGKTTPSGLLTEYSKYSTYQIIEIRNSLEIDEERRSFVWINSLKLARNFELSRRSFSNTRNALRLSKFEIQIDEERWFAWKMRRTVPIDLPKYTGKTPIKHLGIREETGSKEPRKRRKRKERRI